ncbi:MAG: hypothetical protein IKB84_02870 [Clostridia bacterium]|nr:hypothetical protein [Clostridia bacterium]
MEKALRILIILSLIGAIALVAAIFVFWLPSLQAYVVTLEGGLPILSELVYPFSAVIALLCLGALGVALAFPSAMKKDKIFSCPTASKLSAISLLIALAGALIIICAVMLFAVGDRLIFFPLLIISAIILLVAFMLNILSNYVKRAALLKEEVDATL